MIYIVTLTNFWPTFSTFKKNHVQIGVYGKVEWIFVVILNPGKLETLRLLFLCYLFFLRK